MWWESLSENSETWLLRHFLWITVFFLAFPFPTVLVVRLYLGLGSVPLRLWRKKEGRREEGGREEGGREGGREKGEEREGGGEGGRKESGREGKKRREGRDIDRRPVPDYHKSTED